MTTLAEVSTDASNWLTVSKPTARLRARFLSVVHTPSESDANELIEDGLAIQAEIKRFARRPAGSFKSLDDAGNGGR